MLTRVLITMGMLLLLIGLILYGRYAMTGEGSMGLIFILCMSSLGFFNLPAVMARRRDERQEKKEADEA